MYGMGTYTGPSDIFLPSNYDLLIGDPVPFHG